MISFCASLNNILLLHLLLRVVIDRRDLLSFYRPLDRSIRGCKMKFRYKLAQLIFSHLQCNIITHCGEEASAITLTDRQTDRQAVGSDNRSDRIMEKATGQVLKVIFCAFRRNVRVERLSVSSRTFNFFPQKFATSYSPIFSAKATKAIFA